MVTLTPSGIEGFLPSQEAIEIGRVVPATLVCMDGDRALMTYAFIMGTSSRIQHSTASDQENAFAIWAESYPNANRPGRAIDLIMPPLKAAPIILNLSEMNPKEFFPSLEASLFTGCIKASSQARLSRSALLFYKGRAIGSVYSTKLVPESYRFEAGIKKLIEDVNASGSDVEMEMYDLPAEIVLSMSAMFLGYIDNHKSQDSIVSYAEKMLDHFANSKGIACLSLMQEKAACVLGFICNGEFQGCYSVSERTYSPEQKSFFDILQQQPSDAKLKAYTLPAAMTNDSVLFGYSLCAEPFI